MSQYNLYTNANPSSKALYPFLLDVQSPLLDSLETRLVIPLVVKAHFSDRAIKNLTPVMSIGGIEYLVLTPQLAAINRRDLGVLVEDCSSHRNEILSSIDFLITGF